MTRKQISDWIIRSFDPIALATPGDTLSQIVDEVIDYWNTHSAYKISAFLPTSNNVITLPLEFKVVESIHPNVQQVQMLQDFPNTLLLGMTVLDNLTTDTILLSEGYKNYRTYMGGQLAFQEIRSEDPTVANRIVVNNLNRACTDVFVVGAKRILPGEDIKQLCIYEWVRRYARAKVKQREGEVLRKAKTIGVDNDGDSMVTEGLAEQEKLAVELGEQGRWLLLGSRF